MLKVQFVERFFCDFEGYYYLDEQDFLSDSEGEYLKNIKYVIS